MTTAVLLSFCIVIIYYIFHALHRNAAFVSSNVGMRSVVECPDPLQIAVKALEWHPLGLKVNHSPRFCFPVG